MANKPIFTFPISQVKLLQCRLLQWLFFYAHGFDLERRGDYFSFCLGLSLDGSPLFACCVCLLEMTLQGEVSIAVSLAAVNASLWLMWIASLAPKGHLCDSLVWFNFWLAGKSCLTGYFALFSQIFLGPILLSVPCTNCRSFANLYRNVAPLLR